MDAEAARGKVALEGRNMYCDPMEPRPVINIEENIGKTVGRRVAPRDPLSVAQSNKSTAAAWRRALPYRLAPKGVFRFKSHQEANEWMIRHTGPKT
jgi:hypothetical protein